MIYFVFVVFPDAVVLVLDDDGTEVKLFSVVAFFFMTGVVVGFDVQFPYF